MPDKPSIFTIGHSTRTIPEFTTLLGFGPADLVIDVRTVPRSRRNPQFNEDVLGSELQPNGISYLRIAGLGGLRGRSFGIPSSVNGMWENRSFHNYADYALSDSYGRALDELLLVAKSRRCAIMCAEAVWWRCHRRIIADYLIALGYDVRHLMGEGRVEPAKLTPGARIEGTKITYPSPPLPVHEER